jgi:signal peptidase
MKQATRLVRRVADVVGAVALLLVVALAVVTVVVPRFLGGTSLVVLTGSMEPGIRPGDMVADRGVTDANRDKLGVGDVISFLPFPDDPTVVTHRITAVNVGTRGVTYTTKGDDNNDVDPWGPVAASHVRGQVVYVVPKVGYLREWVGQHYALAVTIVGIALIAYGMLAFGASFVGRREQPSLPRETARRGTDDRARLMCEPAARRVLLSADEVGAA